MCLRLACERGVFVVCMSIRSGGKKKRKACKLRIKNIGGAAAFDFFFLVYSGSGIRDPPFCHAGVLGIVVNTINSMNRIITQTHNTHHTRAFVCVCVCEVRMCLEEKGTNAHCDLIGGDTPT